MTSMADVTFMSEWSNRLWALASSALVGTPILDLSSSAIERSEFIATFSDSMGQRRAVDRPILHWLLGVPFPVLTDRAPPDVGAWERLAILTRQFLRPCPAGITHDVLLDAEYQPRAPAPLVGDLGAIEIATEIELSVLHATWNYAIAQDWPSELARAVAAARWMIANVQPDNATGHPWAVHAFVALAAAGDVEAGMYADTLVHNTLVAGNGKPDRFSALLLLDAARMLAP